MTTSVQSNDHGLMAEPMKTIIRLCLGLETKMQDLLAEWMQDLLAEWETASMEAASEGTKTEATREVRAAHRAD